jgi:hypothetical protein
MKKIITIIVLSLITLACQKEELEPIDNTPPVEIDCDCGIIRNIIRDGFALQQQPTSPSGATLVGAEPYFDAWYRIYLNVENNCTGVREEIFEGQRKIGRIYNYNQSYIWNIVKDDYVRGQEFCGN